MFYRAGYVTLVCHFGISVGPRPFHNVLMTTEDFLVCDLWFVQPTYKSGDHTARNHCIAFSPSLLLWGQYTEKL